MLFQMYRTCPARRGRASVHPHTHTHSATVTTGGHASRVLAVTGNRAAGGWYFLIFRLLLQHLPASPRAPEPGVRAHSRSRFLYKVVTCFKM